MSKPLHPLDPTTPVEWLLDAALTLNCATGIVVVLAYVYDPQLLRPLIECLR